MSNVEGQALTYTIPTEYTDGTTVRIAVKFAFSGGMSVTKIFDYVVGSDCGDSDDTTPDDDSENQGETTSNGSCTFTDTEAVQGSFTDNYTIDIKTVEGEIVVTTTLVEEKTGLVAYIFDRTTNFAEYQMTNTGGQTFTGTIPTKYPDGTTAKIAIKFAYSNGGIAITRDFEYIVGSSCNTTDAMDDLLDDTKARIYPNPATSIVNIQLPAEGHLYAWNAAGNLIVETDIDATDSINIADWTPGIYFLRIETTQGILVTRLIKE